LDLMRSHPGYPVKKRGRATGLTSGLIYSLGFNGINRETGKSLKNPIQIVTRDSQGNIVPGFANHGDSGSVVVNDKCQVVGLLTAMTLVGTEGYYFATPIRAVLDKLQIEILV
jgi:S1-C subfamily serine protease